MEPTINDNERGELTPKQSVNTKAIIMTVVVFALIIAGMFMFAFLKKSEIEEVVPEPQGEEQVAGDRFSSIERVDAKHYYIGGVHTLVGEMLMPTPCDLLESSALVAESYPEQITIDFTVINNADTCAQAITPARFKVSAAASEEATFSARLQGRQIELNLIPAAEGETPDEFELFIKG